MEILQSHATVGFKTGGGKTDNLLSAAIGAGWNKVLTLSRNGKTVKTLVRQMPHDTRYAVGSKMVYGSGSKWVVIAVEDAK